MQAELCSYEERDYTRVDLLVPLFRRFCALYQPQVLAHVSLSVSVLCGTQNLWCSSFCTAVLCTRISAKTCRKWLSSPTSHCIIIPDGARFCASKSGTGAYAEGRSQPHERESKRQRKLLSLAHSPSLGAQLMILDYESAVQRKEGCVVSMSRMDPEKSPTLAAFYKSLASEASSCCDSAQPGWPGHAQAVGKYWRARNRGNPR